MATNTPERTAYDVCIFLVAIVVLYVRRKPCTLLPRGVVVTKEKKKQKGVSIFINMLPVYPGKKKRSQTCSILCCFNLLVGLNLHYH